VPAFRVAHVEGFSTAILSLALHVRHDTIRAFDYIYPANLEYFALSRLGATLGVAALSSLPGVDVTLAFRLLVWAGATGLLVGTWILVRRWTGAPPLLVAAALLVVPATVENVYFYNDNVISAALGVGALAVLVTARRSLGTAVGAGALLGLSVVTRADAVLLGPAVVLILAEQEGTDRAALRRAFLRALAIAVGGLVPLVGILALYGASYIDVLRTSTHTVYLWNRSTGLLRQAIQIVTFLGVPGLALAAAGAATLVRGRHYGRLALLAGVPVLYNLITLGKMWQARQLLPLLPLVVTLVVIGWQVLAPYRVARSLAAALVALSLVGPSPGRLTQDPTLPPSPGVEGAVLARVGAYMPPLLRSYDDGPRVLTGRLWNLAEWHRWQAHQNGNQERLRRFARTLAAEHPGGPIRAVLSDEFTSDEYTHFALQEAGFQVRPAAAEYPACARVGELWERRGVRVLHVRLHVPFVTSYEPLIPQRLAADGIPCLDAVRPAEMFYVEKRGWIYGELARAVAPAPPDAQHPVTQWPARTPARLRRATPGENPFVVLRLDSATFAALRVGYTRGITVWARWAPPRERHFMATLPEADAALRSQVGFPRWELP
jgi:hypothetical protein